MNFNKIGIIGGGCFGTALANCFSTVSQNVRIIEKNQRISEYINMKHENSISLPGIPLSQNITCSSSFSDIYDAEVIIVSVPAGCIKSICSELRKTSVPIIVASKGFDIEGRQLISDLLARELENSLAILAGPSFAAEIARHMPAIVNIAGKDFELCKDLASDLSSDNFKIEAITDFVGLQISGALKNVLAIGCGILYGRNFGQSTLASFIVRGIEEMILIAELLGGCRDTFTKAGALGDIILTCNSLQSRNMSFGKFLADGGNLDTWTGNLVEGTFAAQMVPHFAATLELDIFSGLYEVIYKKTSIDTFLTKIFKLAC